MHKSVWVAGSTIGIEVNLTTVPLHKGTESMTKRGWINGRTTYSQSSVMSDAILAETGSKKVMRDGNQLNLNACVRTTRGGEPSICTDSKIFAKMVCTRGFLWHIKTFLCYSSALNPPLYNLPGVLVLFSQHSHSTSHAPRYGPVSAMQFLSRSLVRSVRQCSTVCLLVPIFSFRV